MKVVVATDSATTANMVRGAFRQMKIADAEIADYADVESVARAVTEESVVLVDWEGDPAVASQFVAAAAKDNDKVPVLLLCSKAKAGTTFSGMKAGARGVINKPIEPEDLVRAVINAFKKSHGRKPSVNVEFINPFIEATRNVFTTMVGMECERKKLFLKEDHKMLGDVSGVMGLSGAASGSVVISLPERLACIVMGRMLGEEPAEHLTPDIADGVGELINMIAGQAKSKLAETKYHFTISIPSVVSGSGHEISHKKGTPNIVVLFTAENHEFAIQVCLAPTEEK